MGRRAGGQTIHAYQYMLSIDILFSFMLLCTASLGVRKVSYKYKLLLFLLLLMLIIIMLIIKPSPQTASPGLCCRAA